MASVSDELRSMHEIEAKIAACAVEGSLVLIDLAGSTPYKTRNGESAWLGRLFDFYDAVRRGFAALLPTKYLGDGVLGFYPATDVEPKQIVQMARRVFVEIDQLNRERYRSDHTIYIRIILGFGKVHLFQGNDPQGTCVDQLFRMEKHVPAGCIGITDEFRTRVDTEEVMDIGRIALRGLAGGRHRLVVLGNPDEHHGKSVDQTRRRAALRDIWDLGRGEAGRVCLISGHIPSEPGQPTSIQFGDKDAVIMALQNLAKIGRIEDTQVMSSRDAQDSCLRENVVCVGGPFWNKMTLRFMQEIGAPFIFDFSAVDSDETPIIDCRSGSVYKDVRNGNRLVRDFGFFARFSNPFNPERHVILACGIETQAVAGILEAFSEDQTEFIRLHEALPRVASSKGEDELADFFCLMPFEVEDTGRTHMPTRSDQLGQIVADWDKNQRACVQSRPLD